MGQGVRTNQPFMHVAYCRWICSAPVATSSFGMEACRGSWLSCPQRRMTSHETSSLRWMPSTQQALSRCEGLQEADMFNVWRPAPVLLRTVSELLMTACVRRGQWAGAYKLYQLQPKQTSASSCARCRSWLPSRGNTMPARRRATASSTRTATV